MRRSETRTGWLALVLGIVGGLGGLVVSSSFAWLLVKTSPRHHYVLDEFSDALLMTYMGALLLFFFPALVASLTSLKVPRASGLVLIATGGLSLIPAVHATIVTFPGGLLAFPSGFLVLVAGVLVVVRSETARVRP